MVSGHFGALLPSIRLPAFFYREPPSLPSSSVDMAAGPAKRNIEWTGQGHGARGNGAIHLVETAGILGVADVGKSMGQWGQIPTRRAGSSTKALPTMVIGKRVERRALRPTRSTKISLQAIVPFCTAEYTSVIKYFVHVAFE